jgi:hypothetical protein
MNSAHGFNQKALGSGANNGNDRQRPRVESLTLSKCVCHSSRWPRNRWVKSETIPPVRQRAARLEYISMAYGCLVRLCLNSRASCGIFLHKDAGC